MDSITWSAGAFAFTQTAYLLRLVIPATNALPCWRSNVETKNYRLFQIILQVKAIIQGDSKRWTQSRGRPEHLALHRHPICSNWWFQRRMLKRRRNARCTAVADSVLMNSRTQNILCCVVTILHSTDAAARLCAKRAL